MTAARRRGPPEKLLLTEELNDPLMTPGEVASIFRVDPKTVTRWAQAGKITAIKTLGGHCRFRESEVRAKLKAGGLEDASADGAH